MKAADQVTEREHFHNRIAFYFAAIGSAVGFGNVWRFPSLAYEYGGGAFFVPYLLALFLIGIPVLFLELSLGQFFQRGDVSVFASFHKRMRGVGLASIVCGYFVLTYYSMLIAWCLRAFFEASKAEAPWDDPDVNAANATSYFFTTITGMESLKEDSVLPTRVVPENVGYSFLTFLIIFLCDAFGLKTTGRVTYFTMGFPILLLFVFLIRGCTLDGASDGIRAYIGEWDMSILSERGDSWSVAVSQIFFSLSVTYGIMTAYGSHRPRDDPAFVNTCVIAFSNSFFSFIAGFAVFAAIGNYAFTQDIDVDEVKEFKSFSLVFGTWPVVVNSLPGGVHWVRLLFFDLFLLGIDSAFSFLEAVSTCTKDMVAFKDTPKWKVTLSFCTIGFLISILYASDAGLFFLDTIDYYINFLMIMVGFFESFGLGWIYGIENQIDKFGKLPVFTYMFTHFGSVLFGSAFWFGLDDVKTAEWAGAISFLVLALVSLIATMCFMPEGTTFKDLAMGNILEYKERVEGTIGIVPYAWCFLIKNFVPQVLLVLFINLADSKDNKFGDYSGYPNWPYQVLGILAFVFLFVIVLVGIIIPETYGILDTHDRHLFNTTLIPVKMKDVEEKKDENTPSFPVAVPEAENAHEVQELVEKEA